MEKKLVDTGQKKNRQYPARSGFIRPTNTCPGECARIYRAAKNNLAGWDGFVDTDSEFKKTVSY